jgi:hypothetical protein
LCTAQQIPFEQAYKRAYTITKTTLTPVIDGRLDEDFWTKQGNWTLDFVQVTPYERVPSSSPTRAKLMFDGKYIYVGVYCKDNAPEKTIRFIGNRDENNLGDLISIAFDTYHDFRAAPEFNINVGGNKTDLIVTDKLTVNRSWNAVWEGKTHVNEADSSWTAELRIPFSQLRYNQQGDDVWGLHIRRVIRRNNEVQNWSMIPLKNNGHVFSFGTMEGMTDLPKSKEIEILPYAMGKYRRAPEVPGSPYQKKNQWKGNMGLDAKFGLSDYTMDVTINPDFGQIELDPSVMNLTAYETFYDEKRPFFLEGKHIFDFANGSDMMFYTRRIGAPPTYHPTQIDNVNNFAQTKENVPILGALKLTGTNRNGVTIGIIQSVTARSSAKVTRVGETEQTEVVEPLTNYTVLRAQKNWEGNTLLGGMITSVNRAMKEPHLEDFMVHDAFTAGVDFTQYFNNRLYYIDMKGMFSSLNGTKEAITRLQRDPVHYYQRTVAKDYLGVDTTRQSLNGTSGYVKIGRKGNAKIYFSETFNWISPGFDANNIGYLKQADILSNTTNVEFRQTDIWKIFRSNTLTFTQDNSWNFGGTPCLNAVGLAWKSMFLNRYEINIIENYTWNLLDTRILRAGPDLRYDAYTHTDVTFNTDKAQRVMFMLNYINRFSSNHITKMNTLAPSLTFRLGDHVSLISKFNYVHNTDNTQYVANTPVFLMGCMNQKTYGLTINLQVNITPDMSLQFYASPFTSTAKYSDFKEAAETTSYSLEKRYYTYAPAEISLNGDKYMIQTGKQNFSFANPDFNFNEFRSNLVARWEYKPGSTLYLVWEHHTSDRQNRYLSGWNDNLDQLFGLPATNTFMLKFNYWLNL